MNKEYDVTMECIDWRYSAAILGLKRYFKFRNAKHDEIEFRMNQDSISFCSKDINEDRFLAFAEDFYREDMFHVAVENIFYSSEEFSKEQIDLVNAKLTGNTVMKKVIGKLKFDGTNQTQINQLIEENRRLIVYETFKNKKNLYANYCNTNLFMAEKQPSCRLIGYNLDKGRKSKSAAYNFQANTFVSKDCIAFDFIPFAFSNTYEALFINDNFNLKDLDKTNSKFSEMIKTEKEENDGKCNARNLLFKSIVEVSDFLDYDVEVIKKSRDNEYYETLFVRRRAVDILKTLGNVRSLSVSYKITDKYYVDIQKEALECVINQVYTDWLIELLLKSERNYFWTVWKLLEINYKLKSQSEEEVQRMKVKIYSTKKCAEKIVFAMVNKMSANKVKGYRQKLSSAIIAQDYDRFCDILLQLSSYADVSIPFAYDLFEDFEKNKEVAYTFVAALDINAPKLSDSKEKTNE